MNKTTIDHDALRRRFNPERSLLRRQQLRMLHILIEIDRICKRHAIPYWLSSGTLIGAVRHGGFIPWDDDLDIEMMRPDYIKLMRILPNELPADLVLQTHETDPNYLFFYAKIRDRRSYLEESTTYDRIFRERGIFIDIFPLEKQQLCLHRLSELTFGHAYKIWRTYRGSDADCARKVRRIYRFNRYLVYPLLRCLNRLTGATTITSALGIPYHNPRYAQHIFPLTEILFEGHRFPAPKDSHALLTHIYGDYMALPDIERLHPHATQLKIDD